MQHVSRLFRVCLLSIITLYCLVLFALVALWAAPMPQPWWLALANVVAPWLFAPLLLCVLGVLIVRSWWLRTMVASTVLLWVALFGLRFLETARSSATGPSIRVMTMNQLFTNTQSSELLRAIREQHADVVGIQEFSPITAAAIEQELSDTYPYQYLEPGNQSGLALISRYPLLDQGDDPSGHGQRVTIDFGGQTVTIMNIHLAAPTISAHKSRKLFSLPLITGYDASTPNREIDRLLAGVQKIDGALIMMGDFNTSDREPHYTKLAAVLHDTFLETNSGFGFTFPNHKRIGPLTIPFPLVRIDYVWSKGDIVPMATQVVCEQNGADHCFLVADLQLASAR